MVSGFTLGGVAEGLQARRQQGLQEQRIEQQQELGERRLGLQEERLGLERRLGERRIGIREEALEQERRQALMEQADSQISALMKDIKDTAEEGRKAGKSPMEIGRTVKPMQERVVSLADAAGRDPEVVNAQINATVMGPTPTQIAEQEGQAKARRAASEAETRAGVLDLEGEEKARFVEQSLTPDQSAGQLEQWINIGDQPVTMSDGSVVQPGEPVVIDRTRQDDLADLRANRTSFREAPAREEVGEPGEFGISKPEIREIRDQQVAALNFTQRSDELIDLIAENPEALGVSGRAAQFVNGLNAELTSLRNIGTRIVEGDSFRDATPEEVKQKAAENVGSEFFETLAESAEAVTGVAIDTSRIQGFVVELAFAAAAAQGQTGRSVSDRDVERFMRRIGQSADPAVFTSVLRDVQKQVAQDINNRINTFNRTSSDNLEFPSELEPYLGQTGPEAPRAQPRTGGQQNNIIDFDALPGR